MNAQNVAIDKKWLLDQFIDGMYSFFSPLRATWRYLFGAKRYRVTYQLDNGMSFAQKSETFTADHDRAARRRAKEIAGETAFSISLERYREIKVK